MKVVLSFPGAPGGEREGWVDGGKGGGRHLEAGGVDDEEGDEEKVAPLDEGRDPPRVPPLVGLPRVPVHLTHHTSRRAHGGGEGMGSVRGWGSAPRQSRRQAPPKGSPWDFRAAAPKTPVAVSVFAARGSRGSFRRCKRVPPWLPWRVGN